MAEWKGIVSEIPNDKWKRIVGEYVTFEKRMDHWTCKSCLSPCTGRRYKLIGHLCCEPGNEIKICKKITPEKVEELKGKLGLQHVLTGAHGQQPQQPRENDEIRQENGNKKRKGASGSGTSGSNPREAEMSPIIALNPLSAVAESTSGSDENIWSLQNLESSIGATETWDAHLMDPPGTSHDEERAYVPNTNYGGFQGTNADITHQGQCSSSQGQVDHRHDQHAHPYTSTLRNAFGVEMACEIVIADETQPPCPPGFKPDLWKFYTETDLGMPLRGYRYWLASGTKFPLYEECMLETDEQQRKVMLGFLESACFEVKNGLANATDNDRLELQENVHDRFSHKVLCYKFKLMDNQVDGVEKIEQNVRGETEDGVDMVFWRRNSHTNRWLGYAAQFKSEVANLKVAARKVRSLEDTLQLLSRADNLRKIGDTVIEAGMALLNPVPDDISIWNPTYMSCGSQFVNRNQMPPIQSPPQV